MNENLSEIELDKLIRKITSKESLTLAKSPFIRWRDWYADKRELAGRIDQLKSVLTVMEVYLLHETGAYKALSQALIALEKVQEK